MIRGKLLIAVITSLLVGFVSGFISRPVISPIQQSETTAVALPAAPASNEARGTQYFLANIDKARQIVARCRDGSVRGGECVTAEEAIIKVDAQERRKRFLGN
jgi:hypothetical protein